MNVSELEQRVGELNERLTRAYDDLDQVRKEHGLSPDDVFVLPTVPPEMIDASPELRAVAEERARKLKVLPVDVQTAVARTGDIGDLLLDAQVQLAFILLQERQPIAEIATRTGLNEGDVSALASSNPSEFN
jgi:hypothetical protein